jgi:hypothetical protein
MYVPQFELIGFFGCCPYFERLKSIGVYNGRRDYFHGNIRDPFRPLFCAGSYPVPIQQFNDFIFPFPFYNFQFVYLKKRSERFKLIKMAPGRIDFFFKFSFKKETQGWTLCDLQR